MLQFLSVSEFLKKWREENVLLLDSRSPGEYRQGHIPGAVNLPLLNNEEREQIGITYKNKDRREAVVRGFELVGHKFGSFIKQVNEISTGNVILLYCWRGGMRSSIMAWLLRMAGYEVFLLERGYKEYRKWALSILEQKYPFVVLGGKTGSGKTDLLQKLSSAGEQVIDLEKFASHKGSAFGSLGMSAQPTTEHFENLLASALSQLNKEEHIWIENESRNIGGIKIYDNIYNQVRNAIVIDVKISFDKRLKRILDEYGSFPVEQLADKSKKIERKLGPNNLKIALESLYNNNMQLWAGMMLQYYDRNYDYSNSLRQPETIFEIDVNGFDEDALVNELINKAKSLNTKKVEAQK